MALLWAPFLAHFLLTFLSAITKLFERVNKPLMYYQFVDDTFIAFNDEDECNEFRSHLNSLHSSPCSTFEKECNRILPFLDVLVEKNYDEFLHLSTQSQLSLADTFAGTFSP